MLWYQYFWCRCAGSVYQNCIRLYNGGKPIAFLTAAATMRLFPPLFITIYSRKDPATVDCSKAWLSQAPSLLPHNTRVFLLFWNFHLKIKKRPHSLILLYLDASNNTVDLLYRSTFARFYKSRIFQFAKIDLIA